MEPTIAFRHPWAAGGIFLFTFILVSFRQMRILPIGRPSAALLGAVLMVLCGVMTPEEAYALVNWDTICLLLGMMIIAEHLRAAGMFERFTKRLGQGGSPTSLLVIVSLAAAGLSALLVNDTICVVLTPLILEICETRKLNPFPYLMALATSANIGSALTLTGNPQNMIIGTLSKLDFGHFIKLMILPVSVAMTLNIFLLWLFYGRKLQTIPVIGQTLPIPTPDGQNPLRERAQGVAPAHPPHGEAHPGIHERRLRIGLLAVGLACLGFFSGYSMAFSALGGAVLVITLHRKNPAPLLSRLDWSLLMFFAALFVVIGGLKTSGLAEAGTTWAMHFINGTRGQQVGIFSFVTLAGSNLFSNVPFVLLASHSIVHLPPQELFWCLLAYVSTIAGNLTLFGSVANLIVAESAMGRCEMSFLDYAAFGIPSTILTLFTGILILFSLFPT